MNPNSKFPLKLKLQFAPLLAGALLCAPLCAQAGRAYVSNEDGGSVSVIDTDSGTVVDTVIVGKRPRGLKLSEDGKNVFVAVSGLPKCPPTVPDEECAKLKRDLSADGIAVIDTATLKLVKLVKAGSDPEQFDIAPDGKRLFVSNEDAGSVSVLNVASGTLESTVPVGKEPEGVRVAPNGRWILATSETSNSVYFIDVASFKVLGSATVGKRPRDGAFTPDSKTVFVTNEFDGSIWKVSAPTGTPAQKLLQLPKEDRPMGIILDARRNRLYVSTGRGGRIAIVDVSGPQVTKEVEVGARPWGIALSADGKRLYSANGSSNDVSVLDTDTLEVVKKIPVGKSPWGVVVSK